MTRFLCHLLALALLLPCSARAQFENKKLLVPSLVADTTSVAPSQPFTVGILCKLAPGWHTYWEFPGDAGAPLTVEWTLPAGWQAGPIQWPIPHAVMEEGDMLGYVYDKEVLLPVTIYAPKVLAAGVATLKAALNWLVCEKSCLPGNGAPSLTIKTGEPGAPANADLFAKWRAQLPRAGAPFRVEWSFPNPKEVRLHVAGLDPQAKLEFYPLPPEGVIPDHPKTDPPAADGGRNITIPLPAPAPANATWRGLLVAQTAPDKPREGWLISSADKKPAAAASPAPQPASPTKTSASKTPAGPPAKSLWTMLLFGFVGGLVLNVMPCVLPVIALKIFGFVNQAGKDPARVRKLGLAFVAGVFVFFLALATAVAILGRAFSWGFQFQNAYLLAGLTALVFVFGLNLLGVFEITLSSGATSAMSELSSEEGYRGAFLHGLFTTLLGTSCTAPFLAAALGYATTQPAWVVFLLFLAIATGLALPYYLLTSHPAWLKFVPKPGPWMERFKQAMGFAMLAVAVFLFSVFIGFGAASAQALAWFLFILAIACWLFGIISRRIIGALAALVVAAAGYFFFLHGNLSAQPQTAAIANKPGGIAWQPFSEETLETARKANRPVFIDFTADWCINCKVFERTVLDHESVAAAFAARNVLPLRGDWTHADPLITKWLNKFDRVGVPLYVLYLPGEPEPIVRDSLTRQSLIDQINQAPAVQPSPAISARR
jgi:thiol:disulfide interchange protein DsbD